MSDIFISYAREDRPRVEHLAEALEQRGWSVVHSRHPHRRGLGPHDPHGAARRPLRHRGLVAPVDRLALGEG